MDKRLFFTSLALSLGISSSAFAVTTFENPEDCQICHARQYEEWLGSSHAYAAVSPTFNALEIVGNLNTEGDFSAGSGHEQRELFCQGCHTPVAVELDKDSNSNLLKNFNVDSRPVVEQLQELAASGSATAQTALRGNSCDVCHQAIGPEHTKKSDSGSNAFFYHNDDGFGGIANASFNFSMSDSGKSGPFSDLMPGHGACQPKSYVDYNDGSTGHSCNPDSNSNKGGYLAEGEFCGSCHDVRPGNPLQGASNDSTNGDSFLRLEDLFTEWKESEWNNNSVPHFNAEKSDGQPLNVSCQDCHMSTYPYGGTVGEHPLAKLYPIDTIENTSQTSRKVSSHYFTGVDISLLNPEDFATKYSVFDTQNTLARKAYSTHSGAESNTIDRRIFMSVGQDQRRKDLLQAAARMDVEYDARFLDKGVINFDVTVENIGAGHNVPSGFSQERQFWIGIEVTDATGRSVWKTGYLEGELLELQRLSKVSLEAETLEVDNASLMAAGLNAPANSLTNKQFEDNIRGRGPKFKTLDDYLADKPASQFGGGGPDQYLKFFGNEFKRRLNQSKGVEVFSPFLAEEMDNDHSLAPFEVNEFSYVATGINPDSIVMPLNVSATLNYRAFPPRFLKALLDTAEQERHVNLLPKDLLKRNKVIEMARAELTISSGDEYHAMMSANGRCFDVKGSHYTSNTSPGTVYVWDCHDGDNQKFKFTPDGNIRSSNGLCLSLTSSDWNALTPGISRANLEAMRIGVEHCTGESRQLWFSTTDGRLKVKKGEEQWCLQRSSHLFSGAGRLALSTCWDAVRDSGAGSRYTQQWFNQESFRPVVSKQPSSNDEKCLQMSSDSIEIDSCNGELEQQWKLTQKGMLINATGKCLDILGSHFDDMNPTDGLVGGEHAKLLPYRCHEVDDPNDMVANQQWKFEAGALRTSFNMKGDYYCLGGVNPSLTGKTLATLHNCDAYQAGLTTDDNAASLRWAFGEKPVRWEESVIIHKSSGYCMHPEGGQADEGDSAVMWRSCDQLDSLALRYTESNHLKNDLRNRCLSVDSVTEGAELIYRSACSGSPFVITPRGQLRVEGSDLCVAPQRSDPSTPPASGTKFSLEACSSSITQQFAPVTHIKKKIIQEDTGLCWRTKDGGNIPPSSDRGVYLSNSCNIGESALFTHLETGLIKHLPSGYCVHPSGGTGGVGVRLTLFNDCQEQDRLKFEVTKNGSIRHVNSSLCVHPKTSGDGSEVVLQQACSSGSNGDSFMEFRFD